MPRRDWLEINRKKHGIIWWLLIGIWLRPFSTLFWYIWADLLRYKGVKFNYYK
jgi:hypothetical protein